MNPPDIVLYELYKKRLTLLKELQVIEEKISDHLWDHYTLQKAREHYQALGKEPHPHDEVDATGYG